MFKKTQVSKIIVIRNKILMILMQSLIKTYGLAT